MSMVQFSAITGTGQVDDQSEDKIREVRYRQTMIVVRGKHFLNVLLLFYPYQCSVIYILN